MDYNAAAVRKLLDGVRAEDRVALSPAEGKLLCEAIGVATPAERLAKSAREAAAMAAEVRFPVVMKIVSPEILHKTEAGGVVVGVKSA
ncbi:MAG: acetate--CoA ligase family protein, partial [Candidatus Binataceae bacterium]